MVKKIGILTHYHNTTNYGGMLQAYALCKRINTFGLYGEQIAIDYIEATKNLDYTLRYLKIKKLLKPIKPIYRALRNFKNRREIKRDAILKKSWEDSFASFNNDWVPHSNRSYTEKNISEAVGIYDAFIVGSDQVWNPIWYFEPFFLSFVPKGTPKISYAASISQNQLSDKVKKIYATHLKDFKAISVRESSAVELLSNIAPTKVECVLDPTLLLTKEEWDEVAAERTISQSYAICYFLGNNANMRKVVTDFAKKKNITLVNIMHATGIYHDSDEEFADVRLNAPTPNEFLALIKYADFVFTDSFHASVFSLIFQKQFFVFERLEFQSMGSRISTLTEMFQVEERFCNTAQKSSVEYIASVSPIDYSRPFYEFEAMRDISMSFLKKIWSKA